MEFLLCSILLIPFFLEAFTVYNYKTSIGAGIINVILETNQREAIEFFNMYIDSTKDILSVVFLIIILGYLLKRYIGSIPIERIRKVLAFILVFGIFCTIRGACIYKSYKEEFLLPKIYIFTIESINTINEYKNLYSKVNNTATIIENKSEIKKSSRKSKTFHFQRCC